MTRIQVNVLEPHPHLCVIVCVTHIQVNVLEPHPHLPLLATSGLDSDVKLWMSNASEPANMSTLQRASDITHTNMQAYGNVLSEGSLIKQLQTFIFPIDVVFVFSAGH